MSLYHQTVVIEPDLSEVSIKVIGLEAAIVDEIVGLWCDIAQLGKLMVPCCACKL